MTFSPENENFFNNIARFTLIYVRLKIALVLQSGWYTMFEENMSNDNGVKCYRKFIIIDFQGFFTFAVEEM